MTKSTLFIVLLVFAGCNANDPEQKPAKHSVYEEIRNPGPTDSTSTDSTGRKSLDESISR